MDRDRLDHQEKAVAVDDTRRLERVVLRKHFARRLVLQNITDLGVIPGQIGVLDRSSDRCREALDWDVTWEFQVPLRALSVGHGHYHGCHITSKARFRSPTLTKDTVELWDEGERRGLILQ
jgi:hypothetical protein